MAICAANESCQSLCYPDLSPSRGSLHIRFVRETSNAWIDSSFGFDGAQVSTGLNVIVLCSDLAGDDPRTCS